MSVRVTSSTDLRKNLSQMMDEVNDDHVPYIITRSGGKPAVLISLEDYQSMDETGYLTASPKNRAALNQAIVEADKGQVVEKSIDELIAMEDE